jgi:ribonuclease T1
VVIRRLPPRPEGFDPRPTGALAMALVLALAIGIWLLNGRDPGTGTDSGSAPTAIGDVATADPDSGLPYVELADLPDQAATTIDLIERGGPFRHDEDGSTFGNYEGVLPAHERGYYAEYTVETPGAAGRGARRIVAGDEGELYWTADHYASFARVRR